MNNDLLLSLIRAAVANEDIEIHGFNGQSIVDGSYCGDYYTVDLRLPLGEMERIKNVVMRDYYEERIDE